MSDENPESTQSLDPSTLLRRALAHCDDETVLALVDQLNLQPSARVDVVVVAPIRNLRKSRSVLAFASTAPIAAVRFLIELLSRDALDRVVELLGEASSEPTFAQLSDAVDRLVTQEFEPSIIAAMLASAAANQVPAAAHCQRLLAERVSFQLPEIEVIATPQSLINLKAVDPKIREQRRARREQQKQSRQRPPSRPTNRSTPKSSPTLKPTTTSATSNVRPAVAELSESRRRQPVLTPLESAEFSSDHVLAGCVVELDVPFDDSTDEFGSDSKVRPALVIAGSPTAVLVRPVFTNPAADRVLLAGWNRLGLDHPSYVSLARVNVALRASESVRRFGRLTNDEWNTVL